MSKPHRSNKNVFHPYLHDFSLCVRVKLINQTMATIPNPVDLILSRCEKSAGRRFQQNRTERTHHLVEDLALTRDNLDYLNNQLFAMAKRKLRQRTIHSSWNGSKPTGPQTSPSSGKRHGWRPISVLINHEREHHCPATGARHHQT